MIWWLYCTDLKMMYAVRGFLGAFLSFFLFTLLLRLVSTLDLDLAIYDIQHIHTYLSECVPIGETEGVWKGGKTRGEYCTVQHTILTHNNIQIGGT